MNTSPKTQPYLEQQQHANQSLHCQKAVGQPEQLICTIQPVIPTAPKQLNPSTFLQYVDALSTIIHGSTLLVVALTQFSKIFVPVIGQKPDKKTNLPIRRSAKRKK
ncbi:hypothetical protein H6F96_15250 [Microcoleus sp. FACHB-53]|nr:hypothetical protein [Microcoleus sp. FACHB-53]